ncbi:MAG: type II toxin-antitoxin system PemK/MazF family toxin [Desulfobacterales bacterium]|nr:type II toxin-antitoxin system PemK/MazF family toxin [Desulfobacterales bacterium]
MVINQGDVFWIELSEPSGSEPGYRHPHVVIQNNLFNRSRINTVVVCTLTSNLKRSNAPGNVTLSKGEASLPKKSVVNISQLFTVNKSDLSEKIGTLSKDRISQILTGIRLLTEPRNVDEITSPTMHHSFRPPLSDLKSQKY